jgi:polyvinyl alcohol dehydrogenase (cytochrome)
MSQKFDWRRWRKTAGGGAAVCGLLIALIPAAPAQDEEASDGQWTMGGQNLSNWRNQDDTDINPRNVAKLKAKWVFTTGGDVTATPAVANGVVYFPDFVGNFYAVNAHTGALVWHRQIADWTGIPGDFARNDPAIHRGMVILGDEGGFIATWNGTKYINGNGARVIAADAATGALIWVTQVEKFPAAIVTSSPVIHDGVVYVGVASEEEGTATDPSYPCCTSRGSVVALDVHTGKILWQTYTAPDNGGQPGGYSGGAVWSSTPVIDPKRHSVYVGTGNNYSVPIKDELCAQNSQNGGQNCDVPGDHFDSILALDLTTGRIKWSTRGWPYDPWNVSCIAGFSPGTGNCPPGAGPDFDFGSGPNLFSRNDKDGEDDLLGIGQKSGLYWALNPNNGKVVWKTQVGPGGTLGGIEWGTATDDTRIYVPISNFPSIPYALQPSGALVNGGSWSALDPKTGKILWQTGTPGHCSTGGASGVTQGCMALGPVSVANGVVFGGSMDPAPGNPTMFALDARTGKILWSYITGASVVAGPAIVGNSVYWGAGYRRLGRTGTGNNKLFAFTID